MVFKAAGELAVKVGLAAEVHRASSVVVFAADTGANVSPALAT
jgi:hypothetical protein